MRSFVQFPPSLSESGAPGLQKRVQSQIFHAFPALTSRNFILDSPPSRQGSGLVQSFRRFLNPTGLEGSVFNRPNG
jgi:hypothetical protein